MAKVAELLFVEAVRRYLAALPREETGWLAGLRNPAIGRALSLMHMRLSEGWTADALAREVNLSRSTFADHFTARISVPPMRCLLNWHAGCDAKTAENAPNDRPNRLRSRL